MKMVFLLIVVTGALCSCAVPTSQAVAAHAAGETFSPVAFAGARAAGPVRSPESDKADAFWGRGAR